ncbi:MAG: hypothetical protein K0R75_2543 [Paenibacillaceae bacterium]|nr:hypothetical protein [Paenibacillaceae bacterium]
MKKTVVAAMINGPDISHIAFHGIIAIPPVLFFNYHTMRRGRAPTRKASGGKLAKTLLRQPFGIIFRELMHYIVWGNIFNRKEWI